MLRIEVYKLNTYYILLYVKTFKNNKGWKAFYWFPRDFKKCMSFYRFGRPIQYEQLYYTDIIIVRHIFHYVFRSES